MAPIHSVLFAGLATLGLISGELDAAGANPLLKVIELLNGLSAKIDQESEHELKSYRDYAEWCKDTAKEKQFEIKTLSAQKEKLEAKIEEWTSDLEVAESKISELAGDISKAEAELKEATALRKKEAADFSAGEKELVEVVGTLERAGAVLEREMQKNPAAFMQTTNSANAGLLSVLRTLGAVIDAASFSVSDKRRLLELVQTRQQAAEAESEGEGEGEGESDSAEAEAEVGAPSASAYESHSTGVVDLLQDMKEKAEEQLASLRKAEVEAKHSYEMLKQSLEDQLSARNKELDDTKKDKATTGESKAGAVGDLATTTSDLQDSTGSLETVQTNCMTVAADHEVTVKAFAGEQKVIAEAIKVLQETTGGAAKQAYALLQVAAGRSSHSQVALLVKGLAAKHHSAALAQLASQLEALMRFSASSGENPFGKVKGLVRDMIAKLEKEATAEANEKAFCDKEMGKTKAQKDDLDTDLQQLTTRIDQAASHSIALKEEVKELQGELQAMMEEDKEMDKIRQESHAAYVEAKADYEQGLVGVRKALSVLRDYYAKGDGEESFLQDDAAFDAFMQQPAKPTTHSKSSGAGGSIIGILQVVESDFATSLAKEETEESGRQERYEKLKQKNRVQKASKEKDVEHKTHEFTALDKTIAELQSDRDTMNTEMAAVMEYYGKLQERCIAKPETYEQRKQRRAAEIEGLKQALETLQSDAALLQHRHRGKAAAHRRGGAAFLGTSKI